MSDLREFATTESIEAARQACYAERAVIEKQIGVQLSDDGRIRKLCPVVVMPLIPVGQRDARVIVATQLENLERKYGPELFWNMVDLMRASQ